MRPTAKNHQEKSINPSRLIYLLFSKIAFFSNLLWCVNEFFTLESEEVWVSTVLVFFSNICPTVVCSKCHKKGSESNTAWSIGKEGCRRKNWQEMSELRENVFSLLKKQSSIFSLVEFSWLFKRGQNHTTKRNNRVWNCTNKSK